MSELSEAQIELPRYKCIKEVQAVKIRFVKTLNHGAELYFDDPRYKPLFVDELYRCKHNPSAGGYYVRYKDGYQSWSPADAFEEGYQLIEEPK